MASDNNSGQVAHGVRFVTVDERGDGQRLDNFLQRECPKVPKARVYRAIRKGEIRINKGRAKPERKLKTGDLVRLPPMTVKEPSSPGIAPSGWQKRLEKAAVFEDEQVLVVNKPPGLAVHGGSGLNFGLIETLRSIRSELHFLELVHRLDRDTSGLIVLAKKPAALKELQRLLRERKGMKKHYLALAEGRWPAHLRQIEAPLLRQERASGERIVRVSASGQPSLTTFRVKERFATATLVEASPVTGRTHQIRVHAQHAGHPLLGDDKYESEAGRSLATQLRIKRLFLHAHRLEFKIGDKQYKLEAPLTDELDSILSRLSN